MLLDIDDTLITSTQELGNDRWFNYRTQLYKNEGFVEREAIDKALSEWMSVQSVTKMRLVEDIAPELILQWHGEGQPLMGLTTRGTALATRTVEQLHSLGILLTRTAPTDEEIFFKNGEQYVLFRGGTLFTAGTNKGDALFTFLSKVGFSPKKIVFVNDKKSHLTQVEEVCNQRDIPFIGFRYGVEDERINNFKKDIAEVQWQHFGHILNDRDAKKILEEKQLNNETQKKS